MGRRAAIAIGAHPDDIEFYMAGTLLLLKQAGFETHYFNLASGNCGSNQLSGPAAKKRRAEEARRAAAVLGARFHPSLTDDLEIVYSVALLRRVAAVIRRVAPELILTHSPQDYMEDHTNTCRLVVSAAFARGMRNFKTSPRQPAVAQEVAIYHCMPHGLRDPLRGRVIPGQFVDTTEVHATKRKALEHHASQHEWLASSQGLSSYVQTMEELSYAVGRMSGGFKHAEGWRRHLHLGFSNKDIDPLTSVLGEHCRTSAAYERQLDPAKPHLCRED